MLKNGISSGTFLFVRVELEGQSWGLWRINNAPCIESRQQQARIPFQGFLKDETTDLAAISTHSPTSHPSWPSNQCWSFSFPTMPCCKPHEMGSKRNIIKDWSLLARRGGRCLIYQLVSCLGIVDALICPVPAEQGQRAFGETAESGLKGTCESPMDKWTPWKVTVLSCLVSCHWARRPKQRQRLRGWKRSTYSWIRHTGEAVCVREPLWRTYLAASKSLF